MYKSNFDGHELVPFGPRVDQIPAGFIPLIGPPWIVDLMIEISVEGR